MPAKALRQTRFANARLDPIGVEVLTLSELRKKVSPQVLAQAERVEFFLLLVVHRGRGQHRVDLQRTVLRPGRAVFVRPGQVQQWHPRSPCEGDIVVIEPATLQPAGTSLAHPAMALLRLEEWPDSFDLDAEALTACRRLTALLRRELERPELTATSAALARELLLCLMLAAGRAAARDPIDGSAPSLLAKRFRLELEALVSSRPTVDLLAARLGVSPSTLTRTCRARLGESAKSLVDRRVALEAQRLLVHTDATSAAIGERLGFSEPTNFLKFFRRLTRKTPEAFRRAHRLA